MPAPVSARAMKIIETAIVQKANDEAATLRAESAAIRAAAEERAREVERLEAEFNAVAADLAKRLGLKDQPTGGWLGRLFRRTK